MTPKKGEYVLFEWDGGWAVAEYPGHEALVAVAPRMEEVIEKANIHADWADRHRAPLWRKEGGLDWRVVGHLRGRSRNPTKNRSTTRSLKNRLMK